MAIRRARWCMSLLLAALTGGCGGYDVEGRAAYHRGNALAERDRIDGADAASFKGLSRHHAKDRYRAYFWHDPIEGADPATFKEIERYFGKDARHVYYQAGRIAGADPASFEVLHRDIARDHRNAYVGSSQRLVCSPASLRRKGEFMVDTYCVYDGALRTLGGIDRPSFRLITDDIGRDRKHLYTLRPLSAGSGRHLRRVEGICALASFRESRSWPLDDRCVYSHSLKRATSIDRSSFVALNARYAKDRHGVYYQPYSSEIGTLDGADPQSFEVDEARCMGCAHDRQHCYEDGRRSSCPAR